MHLLTTFHFSSRARADKYASNHTSSISSQVSHARLSCLRRNHHSVSYNPNRSPVAVVALPRASMDLSSRAVQTPRSRVIRSRSRNRISATEGDIMGASPIQSHGISNQSMRGSRIRSSPLRLGTPCTDSGSGVYSSCAKMGAMGSLVLTARERLNSPNDYGKAECFVLSVREAGVAPLRPGGATIGLQVGPLVSSEESACSLRSVQGCVIEGGHRQEYVTRRLTIAQLSVPHVRHQPAHLCARQKTNRYVSRCCSSGARSETKI